MLARVFAQKQKLLQIAVNDMSEKRTVLKEVDKQVKAQLEHGTLGQDKYDALQQEIIELNMLLLAFNYCIGLI